METGEVRDQQEPSPWVVAVCQANHCRSPMIEHLLRRQLTRAGIPATVSSAGTHAGRAISMDPRAAEVLAERGAPADPAWHSTPVTPAVLQADLVVVATRRQRAHLLQLAPTLTQRIFLLRELAVLARHLPSRYRPVALYDLAAVAPTGRPTALPELRGANLDLADPVLNGPAAFRSCADLIEASVDEVVRVLVP